MNNLDVTRKFLLFFVYVIVQVFFAKDLELFGIAFCFIYIHYLLTLPLNTSRATLLFLGFLLGFTIDVFYDTLGIHSAACVFIAYIRPYVINLTSSKIDISELSLRDTGLKWFLTYSIILVFIHHLFLFMLQQFNTYMLFRTILKTLASTSFTVFIIMIIQYVPYSPIVGNARK